MRESRILDLDKMIQRNFLKMGEKAISRRRIKRKGYRRVNNLKKYKRI